MRKTIIAGNWKMNANKGSVKSLIGGILSGMDGVNSEVLVCVPFPYMSQVESLIEGSNLKLGAQNINIHSSGAFTGEVSADMIKDFGAKHVIVGHSERRSLYGETSSVVAEKTKAALDSGLTPLLCVGESLEHREAGKTEAVVEEQMNAVIELLGIDSFHNIIVAYEPVWAIGTGETASPEQAQEMHAFIRGLVEATYGKTLANNVSILYGGSVKPANAQEIFSKEDVDGGLIGGASLNATDFTGIITAF